ncbi:MAG: HEAT repeat protein [Candidatus Jettenia ecosi]|uniref:HEAT repeat protein n=1 Tax=Candidatus Jettenia ecosi TaxID=2494326 RepID=A0A533Q893_9BACT|nr:MAG: HEAT repeat protein [Candidatus Jettenia ecosi]
MITFYHRIEKAAFVGILTALVFLLVSPGNTYQLLRAEMPADEETFGIRFSDGRLSAKLKNSPLKEVLKEIMSQSKSKIWVNELSDEAVTIEFQDMPIREGIHKILKDKNYAFIYAPREIQEGKLCIIGASKSNEFFMDEIEEPLERHQQFTERDDREAVSFDSLAKDALENEDAEKREEAIIALGESKDKKAVEVISKALTNDANEDVRLSAIDALLTIGDGSIIQPLSLALKDQKPSVRESAIEALGAVGDASAIESIKNALNDQDDAVRELAKETLSEIIGENP